MIGHIHAPSFVLRNAGVWYYDIIPCLSMAACFPTLQLYWQRRRYWDVVRWAAVHSARRTNGLL